jgi:hypothetical protein
MTSTMNLSRATGTRLRRLSLLLAALLALTATAAGAADFSSGAFRAAGSIETRLKRGVSTKADVQKLLGVPNGSGAALLPSLAFDRARVVKAANAGSSPPADFVQREIWFYEDIEMTEMKPSGTGYAATMRQQLLMILFAGDLFDGFFWTTNSHVGEVSR